MAGHSGMEQAGVVGRILDILLLFAHCDSLSATEISARSGVPLSTVYRQVGMLARAGFVQCEPQGGRYTAGPVAVLFAARYQGRPRARSVIGPRLSRLSRESGELAAYMVPLGADALCVDAVEGPRVLRCCYSTGATQPLLRGATARAMLAHLPEERRRAVYEAHALPQEQVDALERAHARVRRDAVATSDGELDAGVWGASAPVWDTSGALTGAVSLMAPSARAERRRPLYVRLVVEAANDLSIGAM